MNTTYDEMNWAQIEESEGSEIQALSSEEHDSVNGAFIPFFLLLGRVALGVARSTAFRAIGTATVGTGAGVGVSYLTRNR